MNNVVLAELNRRRPNARIAPGELVATELRAGHELSESDREKVDEIEGVLDEADNPEVLLDAFNHGSRADVREKTDANQKSNRDWTDEQHRLARFLSRGDQRRRSTIDEIANRQDR